MGAWALHRALFEKPSPTIWLIPFLSYNIATTGGLINYALGMGLALLALAYVVKRGEKLRAGDYVALNLIGAALFFCHLIAWAAFALLLALTRVKTLRAPPADIVRRAASALLAQALPLALVALREAPPSTYELGGSKLAALLAPVASMTGADLAALGMLFGVSLLALGEGRAVGAVDAAGARRLRSMRAAGPLGAWRRQSHRRAARGLCLVFRARRDVAAGRRRSASACRGARHRA